MSDYKKLKYAALTLLGVISWSSAYPVIRFLALAESNPFLVTFCRTFFTMVIFYLILLLRRKTPSITNFKANWRAILGMALTGVVGISFALTIGLQYVPAGKSTLIHSINPALIVLMAHFIFHETLGLKRIIGLFLSLIGVFLIIIDYDLGIWHLLSFEVADLFFVFSGLCWAVYSIANRFLGNNIDHIEGLFWVFTSAFILLLPITIIYGADFVLFPLQSWLWMFYLGLVPGAMGNYFWYKGIMVVGAGNAGLINSFLPLSAIILSYLTLGEVLTHMQIIGAVILTFGVWLGIYKEKQKIQDVDNTNKENLKSL